MQIFTDCSVLQLTSGLSGGVGELRKMYILFGLLPLQKVKNYVN